MMLGVKLGDCLGPGSPWRSGGHGGAVLGPGMSLCVVFWDPLGVLGVNFGSRLRVSSRGQARRFSGALCGNGSLPDSASSL